MTAAPAAAIFDLDGTIIPGSSERAFFRALLRARVVTSRDILRWFVTTTAQLPARGESAVRGNRMYLAGKDAEDIAQLATRFATESLVATITPAAMAAAAQHRERGERVVLLSGSLRLLAQPCADAIGADVVEASELEVAQGMLTGSLSNTHPMGRGKLEAASRLAAQHGFDLSRSTAYGDRLSDTTLLRAVATPIAVSPERRLRRYAATNGWQIADWHAG
ncbi:HAD-IB family hydrolase [Candidatus Poribacteria bacterium]|nr:HAD-IB family hydrolase [Candidatus Poribacteria bacterium]